MRTYTPTLYIILSVMLWGLAPPIAKLCLNQINMFQMIFFMLLTATIGLFFIACATGTIRRILTYTFKDYLHFALMGFIGIFIYFLLLFLSFTYSPVQETYVVNYTWPLWMIAFSFFFVKEKFSPITLFSIILSFTGVLVIISQGGVFSLSIHHLYGYVLALLAAISYGLFSALVTIKKREPITSMMLYYFFSFLYASVTMMIFSSFVFPSVSEFSAILWLGVGSCALGFLFWLRSLQLGSISEIVNIVYITPFFALLFIDIIIGESIQLYSVVGLVLIVCSILINRIHLSKGSHVQMSLSPRMRE